MSAVVAGGILLLIPGLGIVGTVDCLILWWYEWICERFGELPGAVWCVGQPERWQIVCYYAGIFLLVFGRKYVEAWKKRGTYGKESVPGDRLHSARTPWCLITRGADESIRNRKRDCKGEMMHRNRVPHLTETVMILGLLIGLLTGNFDCGSLSLLQRYYF